jgi:nucleoporin NUP159
MRESQKKPELSNDDEEVEALLGIVGLNSGGPDEPKAGLGFNSDKAKSPSGAPDKPADKPSIFSSLASLSGGTKVDNKFTFGQKGDNKPTPPSGFSFAGNSNGNPTSPNPTKPEDKPASILSNAPNLFNKPGGGGNSTFSFTPSNQPQTNGSNNPTPNAAKPFGFSSTPNQNAPIPSVFTNPNNNSNNNTMSPTAAKLFNGPPQSQFAPQTPSSPFGTPSNPGAGFGAPSTLGNNKFSFAGSTGSPSSPSNLSAGLGTKSGGFSSYANTGGFAGVSSPQSGNSGFNNSSAPTNMFGQNNNSFTQPKPQTPSAFGNFPTGQQGGQPTGFAAVTPQPGFGGFNNNNNNNNNSGGVGFNGGSSIPSSFSGPSFSGGPRK